jgi:Flp pilus assembly protein TadD
MRDALKQFDRALALHREGRDREAAEAYRECLEIDPGIADAHNNLGAIHSRAGEHDRALAAYDEAIRLRPDYAAAHNNRGGALSERGDQEGALQAYLRAVEIDPAYAGAYNNAGLTLVTLSRLEEAERAYRAAIRARPDFAEAHCNLAYCLFARGEFTQARVEFAWGWKNGSRGTHPGYPWPAWHEGMTSASTLVWGEQGPGDQIFNLSVMRDFATRTGPVTLAVEKRLVNLAQRSFPELEVVARDETLRGRYFDAQISSSDIMAYAQPARVPGSSAVRPYLIAGPGQSAALRGLLKRPGQLLCGISWRSANPRMGAQKSIRLPDLAPLFDLAHVDFLDLQFGEVDEDRAALSQRLGARYRQGPGIDLTRDFDGVAALIDACDIVVTVSNTVAHIAGAIGKSSLVLLPHAEGLMWYWRVAGERGGWYPKIECYRQARPSDWSAPIQRITERLRQIQP